MKPHRAKKTSAHRPKAFDCMAYKDRVQTEIYEETKDLKPAELIRYFSEAAERGPLRDFWKRIPRKSDS